MRVRDFKMRIAKKNPLLDENKHPISLTERFKGSILNYSCYILTKASLHNILISKELSNDLKKEITSKRKELGSYFSKLEIYATFTSDPFIITLNRTYWGGNIIKCEIENAVFFWLISISPMKEFLPRIITELSKSYTPRKIVYWLRYADVQTSEIAKSLPTSNKNIYRWIDGFRISELRRLKNESICLYLKHHSKTMDFYYFKNGEKSLPLIYKNKILKTYTFKELTDIDNLNGKFKRHIRRRKAEIEADRKNNL